MTRPKVAVACEQVLEKGLYVSIAAALCSVMAENVLTFFLILAIAAVIFCLSLGIGQIGILIDRRAARRFGATR
jgi:hypothetical protein